MQFKNGVYKVHIKNVDGRITYVTNDTTFATISYDADSGKYKIETPDSTQLSDTQEQADQLAKAFVTRVMASLGVTPNFVNE